MTVRELVYELSKMGDQGATVTVECESLGDGVFNHAVLADGDLVASWDLGDEG